MPVLKQVKVAASRWVDWAEQNITLGPETSSPGPIKLTAYQRGILDQLQDSTKPYVALEMAAQTGKSTILQIVESHTGTVQERSSLLAMPTAAVRKRFLAEKMDPMFDSNPALDAKIKRTPRGNRYTDDNLKFYGGVIHFGSPRGRGGLKSVSVPIVVADELDEFETTGEDPWTQLMARTRTFPQKLVLACSTPLELNTSLIHQIFVRGNQQKFSVPCISCGAYQFLHPSNFDEDGIYHCEHCYCVIRTSDKNEMVDAGHWEPTNPAGDPLYATFQLNAMYSPFVSMEEFYAEYAANGDTKTFRTHWMAEPYTITALPPLDIQAVKDLVKAAPGDGLYAWTGSVDVQASKLVLQICRWSNRAEPRIVRHKEFPLDPVEPSRAFGRLLNYLRNSAPMLDCLFIDEGGPASIDTEFLTRPFRKYIPRTILIRGFSSTTGNSSWTGEAIKTYKPEAQKAILNVDGTKELGYSFIHTARLTIHGEGIEAKGFFKEMTAEHVEEVEQKNGKIRRQWKKRFANEAWDCYIYNISAYLFLRGRGFSRVNMQEFVRANNAEVTA